MHLFIPSLSLRRNTSLSSGVDRGPESPAPSKKATRQINAVVDRAGPASQIAKEKDTITHHLAQPLTNPQKPIPGPSYERERTFANTHILFLKNRLAPYERRVIELLRNSKDKRARKLAKKRVRAPFAPVTASHLPLEQPHTHQAKIH